MTYLNRLAFIIAANSLLTVAVLAHDDESHGQHAAPRKVEYKEQYKPSPIPDRIILTWSADPATTQDVSWRTDDTIEQSLIEYAIAESGPQFTERAVSEKGDYAPFKSTIGSSHVHTAKLTNLEPSTKYAYRVGDGVNWSEWFHFNTASDKPEPFSFIYFGDAQNNIRAMWSRVIREAHSDAPKAKFILHAGDLVNSARSDGEWGEWFGAGGWLNGMVPSIATPGNHEYFKHLLGRTLTPQWQAYFSFPMNGPEGLKESVYWLDYQGVRIISLNSNEKQKEQVSWLESVLEDNPCRWTIITFHHPIYSSSKGRDNDELRKAWKPVFDKYKVDLVLQGHDHSYARTGLAVPDNVEAGANVRDGNTVYVVSVSGPKIYQNEQRPFFKKSSTGSQLYQVIHVGEKSLTYEAKTATGKPHDSFRITKQADGTNELTETFEEKASEVVTP